MSVLDRFREVKLFVFDVDGVLTDGSLYVFGDGEQVRRMNIKDGFALQLAVKKGYGMMIMSGSESVGVIKRLQKLGITDIYMNVKDKRQHLKDYLLQNKYLEAQVLFMGDDIPDLSVMKVVGLACSPADAAPEVRQAAHFISTRKGGEGCVREVIEKTLKINGDWELETDIPSK